MAVETVKVQRQSQECQLTNFSILYLTPIYALRLMPAKMKKKMATTLTSNLRKKKDKEKAKKWRGQVNELPVVHLT